MIVNSIHFYSLFCDEIILNVILDLGRDACSLLYNFGIFNFSENISRMTEHCSVTLRKSFFLYNQK